MPIYKSTEYGNIQISLEAIASLAGGTITERSEERRVGKECGS